MIPGPKIIAANWKLNPSSLAEAENLATSYKPQTTDLVEVVVLPPFVFLEELIKKFPHFSWGAQDFYFEDSGAYTGEVSLPMLKDIGAKWVLVGHSDRRIKFGETDEVVNKKVLVALKEGFNVILAVGEEEKNDQLSINQLPVIKSLERSVKGMSGELLERLVVAYEPVWAISATPGAQADTPEHASQTISRLKEVFNARYIYGGSVNSSNIKGYLNQPNIAGALVGGASLRADEFSNILNIASQVN